MRRLKALASVLLVASGLLSFEAKFELARVLVAPASLGLDQTTDESDQTWAAAHVACDRPARAARLLEQLPSDAAPLGHGARAAHLAPSFFSRPRSRRDARPARRPLPPDAGRAPPA